MRVKLVYVMTHLNMCCKWLNKCVVNPQHARAVRVTVVVPVCVCVCLLSQISPLGRLFVLKILSRTQWATKVEKFVGFSLKPLRSKVMASFAYPWHPTRVLQRHSPHLLDGRAL